MNSLPGTIVVALGGNAVAPPGERPTIANQFRHTRASLGPIVDLARDGWRITLVHGNGPQVGDDLARNEIAADQIEPLPLGVLVAATAGWMGYMIQQSLQNALRRAGVDRQVVTLVTQVLVDPDEPGDRGGTGGGGAGERCGEGHDDGGGGEFHARSSVRAAPALLVRKLS